MTFARQLQEKRLFTGAWGPFQDGTIPPPTQTGYTDAAGTPISETSALQLADVWACSSLITDSISMLPWAAYVGDVVEGREVRRKLPQQPLLLTESHPDLGPLEWRGRMVLSAVLRGKAVAVVTAISGVDGTPESAWPIHPDTYRLVRDKKSGGRLVCRLHDGRELQRDEFLYMPGLSMAGHTEGLGVVDYHRRAIGLGIATEDFGSNWFRDGVAPSSTFEADGDISDEQAIESQARIIASHGSGKRLPLILSNGLKWKAVTITPNESQFLETMKYNTERIARLFRVPLSRIQHTENSTSYGSGLEENGIFYVTYTLGIWLARLEAEMTRVRRRTEYVKSNVSALLRGNTKDRYLGYAIARQWGWMSVNDIRALEDLPPVDDGDIYLQPLNMIEAGEALKILLKENTPPPEPPPPNGGQA